MDLNIEQAIKADELLKELEKSETLSIQAVSNFLPNRNELEFIANYLEKKGFVNLVSPTENDPFLFMSSNPIIYQLISSGGLSKIINERINLETKDTERQEKKDKLLDFDLKLKSFENRIGKKILIAGIIISLLSFLISILTVEFHKSSKDVKQKIEKPTDVKIEQKNNIDSIS